MDKQIHYADQGGNLGGRNQPGEDEMLFEIEGTGALNKTVAQQAITNEQEFQIGKLANQGGRDGEQVIVAFQFEEAGDVADDDIVWGDVPAGAQRGGVSGGQEWRQGKTAEDFGVLFGAADAGGEILAGHGVGHDDKMRGDPAGTAVSGP